MILLDTHIAVWLVAEPDKLSKHAKEAIRAARIEGGLAIASKTLIELAWLAENGRVTTTLSVESFVRLCASKMTVLPIRRRSRRERSASPMRIRKNHRTV